MADHQQQPQQEPQQNEMEVEVAEQPPEGQGLQLNANQLAELQGNLQQAIMEGMQNQYQQNANHNNAPPVVYPDNANPALHNVPAPVATPWQLARGQKLMNQCPRYARKKPWRQFVGEFEAWVNIFSIWQCGDQFIKDALVWAMKGQAQDMVSLHNRGTPTYNDAVTWRDYAIRLEALFSPRAESQLAKQEFKGYKQGQTEDISSYLATKQALFKVAFPGTTGSFDTLLEETINGIMNKEVKRELRMRNPTNAQEMQHMAVQIVANVRCAYEAGYGLSESKDGLYHTTMLGIREPQEKVTEDPMDIGSMKRKMQNMEELLRAMNTGKQNMECYNCGKKGHLAKDCRIPKRKQPNFGRKGGLGGKPGGGKPQSGGGKFKFACHYCKVVGHKQADCWKKKKDEQNKHRNDGRGRTHNLDEESEDEYASAYQRFLALGGEQEEN